MKSNPDSSTVEPQVVSKVQAARLLRGIDEAREAARQLQSEQQAASNNLVRRCGELDALQDSGRQLALRNRDVKQGMQLLREAVERAKLTALNVGLEGARLGEPAGKALVVMGDEVRGLLARATDALDEHVSLLSEVDRERERCFSDLAVTSDGVEAVQAALRHAEAQSRGVDEALGGLRGELADALGTDPEAARAFSEAVVLAQNLRDSLVSLAARSPLALDALRDLLEPVLSVLPRGALADRPDAVP